MKFFVTVLALSTFAYGQEAPGAAVDLDGGSLHEHFQPPPIIAKAIEGFSDKGKEALNQIREEAMKAHRTGQPFMKDQFIAKLKEASPEDAQKLEAAHRELDEAVSKLSQPAQEVASLAKNGRESGKPSVTDIQAFAKALQGLSDSDRAEYFKIFPNIEQFYKSPNFQKAVDGQLDWNKKQ
ncbi:hypothetical protein QR680_011853 [Steinernema hermaphroditum]|uniref:SXP/RAL-2 family protein Ani s 5-like cation-binding domain-containing protein n=1 Tax=Steinernema hermaphroditum TaxID=289476 RepID=A0AA39HZY7_9BILA|nr:hypothetical protein QR680_011853 [Steinernema hermaphroditum]